MAGLDFAGLPVFSDFLLVVGLLLVPNLLEEIVYFLGVLVGLDLLVGLGLPFLLLLLLEGFLYLLLSLDLGLSELLEVLGILGDLHRP